MDNGGASEGPLTSLADPASETALQLTVIVDEEAYTVAEGETQPVTVRLSADPKRTVVSPLMATPRGDATSGDYSVSASVTFDEGDTSEMITFSATDDTEDGDGDSVLLAFGAALPTRVPDGSRKKTYRVRLGQEGVGLAYALDDGIWVSYILGAPEFMNRSFRELFINGVPSVTPLVVKRD